MWSNYLTAGLRHIWKHKLFSAINILGLGIGLASCIAILLFVKEELSYDSFWKDADNVYHATWHSTPAGRPALRLGATPGPLAPHLSLDMGADIETVTRVTVATPTIIRDGRGIPAETYYVDPNFFDIFKSEFLAGQPERALADNTTMVMTRSAAIKYFGHLDIVGERVDYDTGRSFIVTAVVEDLPMNSHLDYEILVPLLDTDFVDSGNKIIEDWGNIAFQTYIKLKDGVAKERIEMAFAPFIDRHGPDWGPDFVASKRWQLELVPLADVHLHGAARAMLTPKGDLATIYSFAAIAFLILLIACLNFMNLSTARSASRAREVAVRKVLGAKQVNIVQQFLAETGATVLLAIIVALTLVELALPTINELLTKMLRLDYANDPMMLAAIAGLAVVTVIGAGLHPALVTARYRPAGVLRAGRSAPAGSLRLRMVLVVVQFTISIFLIAAAALVYNQLAHMKAQDKGFETENIIWLRGMDHPTVQPLQEAFKKRLMDHPDIISAAYSWILPGHGGRSYNGIDAVDGVAMEPLAITTRYVDFEYFDTYGIELIAGRRFDRNRPTDNMRGEDGWRGAAVIVNEAALPHLGLASPTEAIGKTVRTDGLMHTIVGVSGNTMVDNVKSGFEPMMYGHDPDLFYRIGIRYRGGNAPVRAAIETIWADMFPLVPMRLSFLDQTLDRQFAADRERGNVFAIFAGLAVLVSLLGLYGLASFSTQQRAKEIGVRKVLGARVRDIVLLLLWQFTKPVIAASLIAWPLVFLFVSDWIERFPSQIALGPMAFVGPSLVALALAWLAVGGHAWRVAGTNPVRALRTD